MSESLRLFVVEDNDDIAFVTRLCLERAGHQVTVCHTGTDALIVLGQVSYDLVVLDYFLEDMKGSELLQRLQQDGIRSPVLMVTAYGDQQLAAQVLREGALDYVVRDQSSAYLEELPKRVVEAVTRHRLLQTNSLLIAALESARDGILITDLQGTIQHVNSALERMFGFSRDELLGKNAADIFRSDRQPKRHVEDMWKTLHDRRSWQGELINQRKDGTLLDSSLTTSPIFDARGQMTHFVGIYRDITERKQMERQLVQAQKMHSVGTLAGGVAHEFNNLLAGIQGYATLALREPSVPPTLREFLDYIVQLSDRAANLTRQLLAFARKPSLARNPTSLTKLLETTRDFVQRSLNIEVALEIEEPPKDETWMALADANQLQQVLVNLTLNARDAMAKPQPAPVVFRLYHRVLEGELPAFPQNVAPGDYLVIEVQDRGAGMTPEVLSQAIDPFFTTKEVGKGTGLGLPVAFGIMTGHQGFLTIDSEAGQGTRIGLYLPRLLRHVPDPTAANVRVLEPEPSPQRRILVVDDEQAVQDVIRRFLEIAGHRVVCAASGQEALLLLQEGGIDLVVLDWMIPKEEGSTNFRLLREARPTLPILLCTGVVQTDQASELQREGAVGMLRKPFRMNELWYAVNNALHETA
ncbi:MAG: response regulator [Planctomycetes bacterium]|nr:response regulator [Planctomycetota bacterium]